MMAITIRPYGADDEPAVADFNQRLKAGHQSSQFPPGWIPKWLPNAPGRKIFQEYFLAVDDGGIVHGAYILKHQMFYLDGDTRSIGTYQLPISEGIVDRTYNLVGLQTLSDALGRQPLLYGLGMGGFNEPLPRLLSAMKWKLIEVPFYFRIFRPVPFLRNVTVLRTTLLRKVILDLLAITGLGWVAVKAYQKLSRSANFKRGTEAVEPVDGFADWADHIWRGARDSFLLAAVRDAETLNILYPSHDPRFIRLRVSLEGHAVGWAVVLNTPMSGHKQFGNMCLGSIVDCLSLPGYEAVVIMAASRHLRSAGADLAVTNQSHASWCQAVEKCGYLRGPSNFVFAASPELAHMLSPLEKTLARIHLNRGDGDGPIHL